MDSVRASAPGNLFFAGEHAVVYGVPAIVTSIGKRAFADAAKKSGSTIEIESSAFGKASARIVDGKLVERTMQNKELDPILDLCEKTMQEFSIAEGFSLKISSEIPVESGMSSSTAVLCSCFAAITELFGNHVQLNDYFGYLYPLQVKIHGGKASGSEIYSSSIGGFNKIQKIEKDGKTVQKAKTLGVQEYSIVVGNTKVRGPTALTVGVHVPSLQKRNPGLVQGSWKKIEAIVGKMQRAVRKGNAAEIGKLMNTNQKILGKLMLSHPKLDDCINEALKAGALGAKLSGGGWGGVMFALVNKEDKEKVAKAIESTGSEAIITEIGGTGVIVEK